MTNENVRNEVGGRPWSKNKDLKTGTDGMPDKRELPVDDMQAKNSKNAQEEECVMKLNEMKNSKSVQKVENQQVSTSARAAILKEIEDKEKPAAKLNDQIKDLIFELKAPSNIKVSNETNWELIKALIASGVEPMKAMNMEKEDKKERIGLFETQLFPNCSEITEMQEIELNRQIVILDACRVTKEVKGRRIHYLHCRVVSRDKLLMITSASLALFKSDALYPLIDKQLSEEEQDITAMDFKEVEYEFERLEKPVIITGQILRKIDINPFYKDEEHIEKLATVVRLGVDKQELNNGKTLQAKGETKLEAIKRYRAFIEAAGISE